MQRKLWVAALAAVALLLSGSSAVQAWHTPNENENEKFTAYAGDPRIPEDGAACFDQVADHPHGSCAILYPHFLDLLNPAPTNLQRPGVCNEDPARGFTAVPSIEPFWSFNRFEGFSSPGFVEYTPPQCDNPRMHPERGLTSNVMISQDVDILGYFYLSADSLEFSPMGLGTGPEAEPSLGVMPCVTVRMELWTGRHVSSGANEPLAIGQTTKTVASVPAGTGDLATPVADPCLDAQGTVDLEEITEFEVNLGKAGREIRAFEGYVIGIQMYFHDNGDPHWDNDKIMYRDWNLRSSEENPARLLLSIENPLRIERMELEPLDGKLYIHSVINSPWGSYDVDTANLRVQVLDERGHVVADQDSPYMDDPILYYSVDHDGHFLPVEATFPWDHRSENLPPGEYTVRVIATNWQHTADAEQDAALVIDEHGDAHSGDPHGGLLAATVPLPGIAIVLSTIGAALVGARSRKA